MCQMFHISSLCDITKSTVTSAMPSDIAWLPLFYLFNFLNSKNPALNTKEVKTESVWGRSWTFWQEAPTRAQNHIFLFYYVLISYHLMLLPELEKTTTKIWKWSSATQLLMNILRLYSTKSRPPNKERHDSKCSARTVCYSQGLNRVARNELNQRFELKHQLQMFPENTKPSEDVNEPTYLPAVFQCQVRPAGGERKQKHRQTNCSTFPVTVDSSIKACW